MQNMRIVYLLDTILDPSVQLVENTNGFGCIGIGRRSISFWTLPSHRRIASNVFTGGYASNLTGAWIASL